MKAQVARRLLQLNQEFYQTFAGAFAESRRALPPGILRAVAAAPAGGAILDAGCGDGRAAQALAAQGWAGVYVGADASPALLALARARSLAPARAAFVQADLARPAWVSQLSRRQFDRVWLFAVLHHIPGARRRARVARQAAGLLRLGGQAVFSAWQFWEDERLRRKIVPWSRIGLGADEVEPGDYLLDWKRGGEGLRYVAALGEAELRRLAEAAGLRVEAVYRADGRTGGLSAYVMGRK